MKALVFLLVLGNLLFYAFSAGYFGQSDNPDAARLDQQVAPERIRIVARGDAPALPANRQDAASPPVAPQPTDAPPPVSELPAAAPVASAPAEKTEEKAAVEKSAAVPETCLAWRNLTPAEADKVAALLGKRFEAFKLARKSTPSESNGWWVHIPPLATKADAERKANELRALGVTDFFQVQEGPGRNAISLGIFNQEKGGRERLAELKAKGVRSAIIAPRPGKDESVALQVRGPAADKAALIKAVADAAVKAEALACR